MDEGHRCWCNVVPMSLVPRAGRDPRHRRHDQNGCRPRHRGSFGRFDGWQQRRRSYSRSGDGSAFPPENFRLHRSAACYPTMAEALKIIAISRCKDPQGFRAAQTRFLSYRGFAKPAAADRGVGDRIVAGEFGRLLRLIGQREIGRRRHHRTSACANLRAVHRGVGDRAHAQRDVGSLLRRGRSLGRRELPPSRGRDVGRGTRAGGE
jgi:hypothetical protein